MKIYISKKAGKELDKLPDPLARKIKKKILGLEINPFPQNSIKLTGEENYRLKVGVYRVIYFTKKIAKEINILKISHRKDVCKKGD